MNSGSYTEPEFFGEKMRVTFTCSWRDYRIAVAAKLKATPEMVARPWSRWAASVVSSTFARLTKLRGVAAYDFDEAGVRRFANGVAKAKFSWADFTHWEEGGNAYWLLTKDGAALVPLRMMSLTDRTEIAKILFEKLGPSRPLSAFEGVLAKQARPAE